MDIAVDCVAPAAARTPIFDQMSEERIASMLSKIPRDRFLEVAEAANMLAWPRIARKQLHHLRGLRPDRRVCDLLRATPLARASCRVRASSRILCPWPTRASSPLYS